MDTPLISVIVPIYNVDKYLDRCVTSIREQTYENLQIILVDDGSQDGSSEICDELSATDQRIHVIHQENQGAATARKVGISYATGKYSCFVDADDYIAADMIQEMYQKMGDSDLVSTGCHSQKENGEWFDRIDSYPEGDYQTQEELDYILSNLIVYESRFQDGFLPFLVNKMYRTDMMKRVVQEVNPKLKYAEDRDLLFRYVLQCKKITIVHQIYYYYCFRKESAVNAANINFLHDLNGLYISLQNAFRGHKLEYSLMYQLQLFIISRLYSVPVRMGFVPEAKPLRFIVPYETSDQCKKVVLYGAGWVGRDFHTQLYKRSSYDVVSWVDKDWKNYQNKGFHVNAPDRIREIEYDYIILAVKDKHVADKIKQDLCENGIPAEKILWKAPIIVSW